MRLRSRPARTKRDADERSSGSDHQQDGVRKPDRPADHSMAGVPRDNFWSLLRHGTASWVVLARLLVLFCCLAVLGGAILCLLWFLGVQVDVGPIQINTAGERAQLPSVIG